MEENMKINKKPKSYVNIQKKIEANNEYDKYLKKAVFNYKSYRQLINKCKDIKFKKYFLSLKDRDEGKGYEILLNYSNGTYEAYIEAYGSITEYSFMFEYIEKIFGLTRMVEDSNCRPEDGKTYFVKKFNDFKYINLRDLFTSLKSKEDKKIFERKYLPNIEEFKKQTMDLIDKVNALFALNKKMREHSQGQRLLKKYKVV
jgi:hypothetical protein